MRNIHAVITGLTTGALMLTVGAALADPIHSGTGNGGADSGFDERFVDDRLMVFFAPGSARLTPVARETLEMFAQHIGSTGYTKLVVKGYGRPADAQTSDVHQTGTMPAEVVPTTREVTSKNLAQRRAAAVVAELASAGVHVDARPLSIVVEGHQTAPNTAQQRLDHRVDQRVDVIVERENTSFPVSMLDRRED